MTYQYQFYYLLRRPVTAHAYYPVTAQLLPNNCARLLGASTGHPPVTGQLLGQLIYRVRLYFHFGCTVHDGSRSALRDSPTTGALRLDP
jgi:hypothetical protein